MMKSYVLILTLPVVFLFTLQVRADAQTGAKTSPVLLIESGKFRIYESKQVQGEESYEIRRDRDGLIVEAKFDLPFWGEEKKPSLTSALRMRADLTPESFEIKGVSPLEVEIDTSVIVRGRAATVSEGGRTRQLAVPASFFTLAGYAPVTMEMMAVRYWLKRSLRGPLQLLPGGEAFVEHRGRDSVIVGGERRPLDRYSLGGVGWGRQTLWLDSEKRLVAVVNIGGDVETNFSAIRDGYDPALPFFLKRAAEDGIDRLTEEADRLSPKRVGALVLLGGTLIDGAGKPPVADSAIVIDGDRITFAGPRSQAQTPKGATVVDASGKYVLPGLWDMHAHLYQVEFGPAYLAAGITTARDVGNEFEFVTTLRDAVKQGRGLGPRMLLAGYIEGKNDKHQFDVQVDTPEEARAAVRRYKDAGFEQLKIRDHVKLEILKVITAEAHRLGMTVTGHVPEGMNALQAVEAGQDQINHINFVIPAFEPKLDSPQARQSLRVFIEHGTVIDPTIATIELMLRPKNTGINTFEPGMDKVAPELIEQLNQKGTHPLAAQQVRAITERMLLVIGALHRSGIPIVAGTDVSVPGHTLHRELELYVKAGLTPMEAIQSATLTAARAMKLANDVGTIEAGKRADIIILDENPLDNISNIRKVKSVVARGRLFDCARLWQSVGFKP